MGQSEDGTPKRHRLPRPAARRRDVPTPLPDVPPEDRAQVAHSSAAELGHKRRTLGLVVIAVGLVLALGIPAFGIWSILLRPQTHIAPGAPVHVVVAEGADTRSIADTLVSAGVIANGSMFRVRARIDGIDGKLRPGEYDMVTGAGYDTAVAQLLKGPSRAYVTVTIPEGFTIVQIAGRVEKEAGISAADFNDLALKQSTSFAADHPELENEPTGSLEGYLFPKTYRIAEGSTAREVIDLMLTQFDTEIASVDLSYAASKNLDLHDVVTIASMIEREARVPEERPLVSSVIYNRLRLKMHLEIDATIEYILPGTRPRLLNKHLKIDSPYNTYMYDGLPPGPIASPGLASLEAAAHPADTEYLYYVLTSKDGSHTFTKTLEEFLIAKEKSREVVP